MTRSREGIGRLGGVSSAIRRRWIAAFGVAAGLLAALVAGPAFAHDELIGTDPAADSAVGALPASVTLTFSGVLLTGEGATEVVVTDAAGTDLTASAAAVDGVRVTQALTGPASGPVQVAWRVVSSDGHPISGQFSFTVGDAASVPSPASPVDTAGAEGDFPVWIVVGVIVVVVVGAVVLISLLSRRRPSRED
jgi:methionine-rich copper-binding protein CopC